MNEAEMNAEETREIAAMRIRLQRAIAEMEPVTASPGDPIFRNLLDTRPNTKTALLSTEWGKANPPPRNFRITLAKEWLKGEITLPLNHVSWFLEVLLNSPDRNTPPEP